MESRKKQYNKWTLLFMAVSVSSSLKYPFSNIKRIICEKVVIWLEISTLNVITTIVIVVSIYRLNRPKFKDC